MMTNKNCPSQERLLGYSQGTLSPEDVLQIEQHVHACPECEGTLNLTDGQTDTVLSELRKGPPSDIPTDVEYPIRSDFQGDIKPAPTLDLKHSSEVQAGERTLGNYILLEKIGAGGMGQVYKARHQRMDRVVALKVLPAKFLQDKAAVARFEREVKAAARITHPNIVAAFDADVAENEHFLVMEYVEGNDLSALVKKSGTLGVKQAVNCVLQAARGLEAAHANGIIHRDIKPANLLLDRKGTIKILDMGLARLHDDTGTQAELTATGAVMGTVDFMAPEQALDSKAADHRADIYSLGCTLYYLLSGRPTYHGETLTARLLAHQSHPIPDLCSVQSDVPEALENIFQKMISKKPSDRYQTVTELIADLESLGTSVGIALPPNQATATRLPTDDEGRKRRNRWRTVCGITAAAIILLAVIVIVNRNDGTKLVVEVNVPGAKVEVVNEVDNQVKVTTPSDKTTIEIGVEPGTHRIVVSKDGFRTESREHVEIKTGKNEPIRVSLVKATDKVDVKDLATVKPERPVQPTLEQTKTAVDPKNVAATDSLQAWLDETAKLPPEKRFAAVDKKLRELNPLPEGQIVSEIRFGGDGSVSINYAGLTDVRPLHALKDLSSLGFGELVHLRDLTQLRGLKLTSLSLHNIPVSDLTGLEGMPLESLSVGHSWVSDLTPLRGMPLKQLNLGGSLALTDLSPLEGMAIEHLRLDGSNVTDLSSLVGMPLNELNISYTRITDLSPLAKMPLQTLLMLDTGITDLTPLTGAPLETLRIDECPISDLSPLKGAKLRILSFKDTLVTDVGPLAEATIQTMYFDPHRIRQGLDTLRASRSPKVIGIHETENLPSKQFWQKFDDGEYVLPTPWIKSAPAEFAVWAKEVAALPLEKKVEAVSGKLMELNPKFDGVVKHQIEFDEVTSLSFFTDAITDISPVRALTDLQTLECGSQHGHLHRNRFSDLSPIEGMELRTLKCAHTYVSDLSALANMPLTYLDCTYTRIADLSPLKGMNLEYLFTTGSPIANLSPLQGMPLKVIRIGESFVSDLSPLQGAPLVELVCPDTLVSDLSPLQKTKIYALYVNGSNVSDLTPIATLPLKQLGIEYTRVTDLEPLKGRRLDYIAFSPERISNGIDVLKDMTGIRITAVGKREVATYTKEDFFKKYGDAAEPKPSSP